MSLPLPHTIYGLLNVFLLCARVLHPRISQAASFPGPPRADPLQNAAKAEETPGKSKHICVADARERQLTDCLQGRGLQPIYSGHFSIFDYFTSQKATWSEYYCESKSPNYLRSEIYN